MLELTVLPDRLGVSRLDAREALPSWALESPFFSITRTGRELSLVSGETDIPPDLRARTGFRALEVSGPLDFALTGILFSLLEPLAEARIPVFVISTHDTDYVLVRDADLERSVRTLRQAGHRIAGYP